MSDAAKPQIEIRRKIGPGSYRSYANIYWRPRLAISFYAFGKWRWLCGRPQEASE
jgi:hypothetical protein